MPLTVEDGTGKADADSFVDVDDFRDYWEDRNHDFGTDTDDMLEGHLRMAFDYLMFAYRYPGQPATIAQRGPWPRTGVRSGTGWYPANGIPTQIVSAQMLLAIEAGKGTPLLTKREIERVVVEESKTVKGIGKTVKYATGPVDSVSNLPRFAVIDTIMRPLIVDGDPGVFKSIKLGRHL